jgi:hypothetical protein
VSFWRLLRGVLKILFAIVLIVAVPSIVAVGAIEIACRPEAASSAVPESKLGITDANYHRDLANTYFTFPEWYIVYSFEDFGRFLDTKSESAFPYLSQIEGFWRGFCAANLIAGGFPGSVAQTKFNLYVIGISFSFEYAVKGLYENTIGRLTEWLRGPTPTIEDGYARAELQDYGHFLHEVPWYRYPFGDALIGLWSAAPLVGASPARNIERHLSLSAEYGVKQGYAALITLGLAATSDPAPLRIMFVVRGDARAMLAREPNVRLVRTLGDGLTLLEAPRYERFTQLLLRLTEDRLAADRVEIVEIAGNQRILVSVIAPESASPAIPGAAKLFSLPIDAKPGFRRVGYDADVTLLTSIVSAFREAGIEVEHFYDY